MMDMRRYRLRLFTSDDVCVFDDVVLGADMNTPNLPTIAISGDDSVRTAPLYDKHGTLRAAWEPV
jgi:hypothetical protein